MSNNRITELHSQLTNETDPEKIRMLAREYSNILGSTGSLQDSEVIVTAGAFGVLSSLLAEQNNRVKQLSVGN